MSWTLIEHQALSSSAASVTLGSGGTIPQTYKTLKLVVSMRCDRAGFYADNFGVRFNGDTASNYVFRAVEGNGGAASSYSGTQTSALAAFANAAATTANTFASADITIPNYTGSNQKAFSGDSVTETNSSSATQAFQTLHALNWTGTAAITSVTVLAQNSNLVSGSTFTLYGLA